VALFWSYNDAQQRRLLRIINEYFSRSALEWAGSGRGCRSLRICEVGGSSPSERAHLTGPLAARQRPSAQFRCPPGRDQRKHTTLWPAREQTNGSDPFGENVGVEEVLPDELASTPTPQTTLC